MFRSARAVTDARVTPMRNGRTRALLESELDLGVRVGIEALPDALSAGIFDALRFWGHHATAHVVLVVGGSARPARATRARADECARAVGISTLEVFTSDEVLSRFWEAARALSPPCRLAASAPAAGLCPEVFEGDPQCRALGARARANHFVEYARLASDGGTVERHVAKVVAGDEYFFDSLGGSDGSAASKMRRAEEDVDVDDDNERDEDGEEY